MADGRVVYQIVGDTSQLSADLKSAEGIIQQSASSWDSLAKSAAAAVGTAFTAATAAGVAGLTALGKEGLAYNTQLEQSKRSFATFLGDEKEAEKVMQKIVDYAAVTPFDVENLTNSVKMLVSADIAADEAIDTVLALGDAVAATGGGADTLSRMAANLQQVRNVGKASAMDVKQFAMAGINIYKVLSDYTGLTVEKLQSQEISYAKISAALKKAAAEGGRYYGAMESQSETLDGKVSTLKDTFTQFTGRITEDLTPAAKVVVSALTDMLNNSGELEPVLKSIFTHISDGIITVVEKAGNLGDLISPVAKDISDLGSHLTEIMPKLKDLGGDVLDRIKERAGQLNDTLKPLAEEAFGGLKSSLSEIMPNLSELGDDTLSKIKSAVADVDSKLESMIPKLGELGGELLEKIRDKADGLREKFEPLVNDVISAAKGKLDEIMPDLRELGDSILANIADSLSDMESPGEFIAETLLPVLADNLPKVLDLSKDIGDNIIEPITSKLKELNPKLEALSSTIIPPLSDFIGKIVENLDKLVKECSQPILDFVTGVFDPTNDLVEKVFPDLTDFLGKIVDLGTTLATELLPPILDHVKGIYEKLEPLAANILSDIFTWAGKIADGASDFVEKISPVVDAVGDVAEAFTDLLVDALTPLWDYVSPIIDEGLDKCIEKLDSITQKISDKLVKALDSMKGGIEDIHLQWNALLLFMQGDFKGGWDAMLKATEKTTKDFALTIIGILSDMLSDASSILDKMITTQMAINSTIWGVVTGDVSIGDAVDYYKEQKAGITEQYTEGKETLNSIGGNVGKSTLKGAAEGLKESVDSGAGLIDTAKNVANGIASGLKEGLKAASEANKTSVTVNVNSKLDLDGDTIASSTFSRFDDYANSVIRGQN